LREPGTANDSAFVVLILLTYLAMLLFIPLLIFYVALIVAAYSKKGERKTG
jgi:hypothetical protein